MTENANNDEPTSGTHPARLHRRALIGGAAASSAILIGQGRAHGAPQAPITPMYQRWQAANLPEGQAIAASPRLPLYGIGENDIPGLINGQIADWSAVGSPVPVPVSAVALDGSVPAGMTPAETFASYSDLAAHLNANPGAFAMIPVSEVDFRVSVLSVSGFDPLRHQDNVARIAFVGDIVPGRNVSAKSRYYGDWSRPFRKIADELKSYDAVIANLEGNVSRNIAPPTDAHTFSFVAEPEFLEGLVFAGIDAVSLANNHSAWNADGWGLSAFNDTRTELDTYGIPYFGGGDDLVQASAPFVVETKGMRIAITGIDGVTANEEQWDGVVAGNVGATMERAGTNPFVTDYIRGDMGDLAGQYDVVIPYFHMGVEYVPAPPGWALEAARGACDAGATMVVTNHPHVIQGMEYYGDKPIVYSVGNFVFDQMFSNEVRTGTVLEIVLQGGRVVGVRPKGVEIIDFHQPRLMNAGEQASLMDRFWQSEAIIASR
jgi:poly-gamma-glutamate synthesis protein (capsule biosynthesis protein)